MTANELYGLTLGVCGVGCTAMIWRRATVPVAFALAAVLIYVQAFHFWDFVVDDAYISFRYARNFAHGDGLVFNRGEHVEGYTDFSWVLLLALSERLGIGIVEPSRWLGYAAEVGTLLMLYLLSRRLVPESRRAADLAFAVAALTYAALPATGYWAGAGLEEPLLTFLTLLALSLHIVEDAGGGRPYSALVALAAAVTRPEGAIVAAVIFACKLYPALRSRDLRALKPAMAWLALFAMPYAGYVAWRWSYYGYPLPNTYYQKVGGGPTLDWARYREGADYLQSFWTQTGAVLLFPFPLIALFRERRVRMVAPLVAFSALWVAYAVYVGGDFMSFHRFLLPVVPIALLLFADTAVFLAERAIGAVESARTQAAVAAIAMVVVVWLALVPQGELALHGFRTATRSNAEQVAAFLKTQDPSTYVAVGAAGYIPYETDLKSLDTLGLTDEHIAHGPRLSDRFNVQGHRKGDGAYVLSREPDIILVATVLTPLPVNGIEWRRRRDSGELLGVETDILRQPELWTRYESVVVFLPRGGFSFFRRIGSTKVQATRTLFQ